jgi:uncharacterized repeat protein (TIGR02543 family)
MPKSYTIYYNTNEGSAISPGTKQVYCTFKNWNTKTDGTGASYNPGAPYSSGVSATLYAQWNNPVAGELSVPVRASYTFKGWYTSSIGGTPVTPATIITGDMNIYAQWEAESATCIVSYDANGGAGAPAQQINPTQITTSLPSAPKAYTIYFSANGGSVYPGSKQVDCTFRNWNTLSSGTGTSYNSGAPYTFGISATLYAQWNNPVAGELPTPTRTSYTFKGWYTVAVGGTPVTPSTIIISDTTIYAQWEAIPITYTVSYNANGGADAPAQQTNPAYVSTGIPATPKSYTVTFNAGEGTAMSPGSKQVNCIFKNWNTISDGSGISYDPGAPYTSGISATLYAQWNNPAIGELPTPTKTSYTFKGWYTAATGGTQVIYSTIITGNTTIYAQWDTLPNNDEYGNTFSDAFNWELAPGINSRDGAINYARDIDMFKFTAPTTGIYTISTSNLDSSIAYLDIYLYPSSLNTCVSKLAGYGTTVSLQLTLSAGEVYYLKVDGYYGTGAYKINISVPSSTNIVLSYDANGGAGAPSQQTNPTHVSASIPVSPKSYTLYYNTNGAAALSPDSKKVNCTFRNWNTISDGSGTSYNSGAQYLSGVSATLYAQWNNPVAGELPTPVRVSYAFLGWYTAATGGTLVTSATVITDNMTVYAHWKQ